MKKKIKLENLKVQSFVTALSEEERLIAKGGYIGEEVFDAIPKTMSLCGFSICQMGTVCTIIHETQLATCIYCKPKTDK